MARLLAAPVLLSLGFTPSSTELAIANGDTRTIVLSDSHTNESGSFTYMVDGTYDSAVLDKLNWFLRDWRLNELIKMDPKLFDIIWEVYRESGSTQPIDVLSGYRSPQTNAMLRRRSRQVAQYSQHMQGKAIDAHFVDVGTATIRDIAMRMEAGGVGFYPTGATPWVHIDSGSVRYWPRMSRDALARLFPDGKTVFIPADGQPMAGYEQARAEIESRGGEVVTAHASNSGGNILSWLFGGARGGGADDEEEGGGAETAAVGRGGRTPSGLTQVASETPDPVASAKRDLPRGATYMQPGEAAPQAVAANDADAQSGGSQVTLRGPIAAQFIAPTPPRKPAELAAAGLAEADTPTPPQRPAEFAFGPAPAIGADSAGNPDLIAALLATGTPSRRDHTRYASRSARRARVDGGRAAGAAGASGAARSGRRAHRAAAARSPVAPPRRQAGRRPASRERNLDGGQDDRRRQSAGSCRPARTRHALGTWRAAEARQPLRRSDLRRLRRQRSDAGAAELRRPTRLGAVEARRQRALIPRFAPPSQRRMRRSSAPSPACGRGLG